MRRVWRHSESRVLLDETRRPPASSSCNSLDEICLGLPSVVLELVVVTLPFDVVAPEVLSLCATRDRVSLCWIAHTRAHPPAAPGDTRQAPTIAPISAPKMRNLAVHGSSPWPDSWVKRMGQLTPSTPGRSNSASRRASTLYSSSERGEDVKASSVPRSVLGLGLDVAKIRGPAATHPS